TSQNCTRRVLWLCRFHQSQSKLCFPDGRRRSDGSFAFFLFFEPLHRAGLPYGFCGLRLAAPLGRFGLSAVIFEETGIRHRVLNQSRNWAVESTWSSCLPLGKTVISCRYSASQGAFCGMAPLAACAIGVRLNLMVPCSPEQGLTAARNN